MISHRGTRKILIAASLVAAALSSAACGGSDASAPASTARVRFFNATTGLTANGGFTANGQFASGSPVAPGQATSTCATLDAGATSFAFGIANSGGSALSGAPIATLNDKSLPVSGDFTVAAAGSATNASLYLIDNTFSGSIGANQAAVRFVNLVPEAGTAGSTVTVIKGTLGVDGTVFASNITLGVPTSFATVTSGSTSFTILQSHATVIAPADGTINLQAGTANTIAIVPTQTPSGFKLVNIPRCS